MAHKEGPSSDSDVSNSQDVICEDDENIIKLIVTNDINLGYELTMDRDQEDDSFNTFEEILKYARDFDVDAILLGGNLFYEANPPLHVIMRCISLLRAYCLGQKPVKIDCITDPGWIFNHCPHKIVNFKDKNLNIGIPIFSICGHRDTPICSPVGPLDLLAATGLVNYFGEWTDAEEISIPPVLLRKGITTLALYGLNHMSNEKLSKLIKRDKFELLQEEAISEICSVLLLHQKRDRPGRAEDTFIPESLLPDFLNLVIWGHEPACHIYVQPSANKPFYISQPGSTIATSLTKCETLLKHVGLLKIYKDKFNMKYIKLKTVRPFVFDRLILGDHTDEIADLRCQIGARGRLVLKSQKEAVEEFVDNYIKSILQPRVSNLYTGHPKQPKKPLLRLKIICDLNKESDRFDSVRLCKKYEDEVANPKDMFSFSRQSEDNDSEISDDDDYEELSTILFQTETEDWKRTVEGGISEHYNRNNNNFKVLSINRLNKALQQFKNHDKQAFNRVVRDDIRKLVDQFMTEDIELDDAMEYFQSES